MNEDSLRKKITQLFGMDLRALAVLRMGLAAFTLSDLAVRARDLTAHYTDTGILPRSVVLNGPQANPLRFSLHLMSGDTWVQAALFLVTAVFALMLLAGWRTRLAAFAVWFMTASLHARNWLILQGGDVLFHLTLLWSLFLPLGACYSVDRALDRSPEKPPQIIFSAATLGFWIQICCVYWFAVAIKLSPVSRSVWWNEGMAVYYTLSVDIFARPFAQFVLSLPLPVLKFLNYYVLALEGLGPFFLLLPFWNGILRTIAAFLFMGLHFGFSLCMTLGPFPQLGILTMIPFLGPRFWDGLSNFAFRQVETGFEIHYDRSKYFSQKAVSLLGTFLVLPAHGFQPILPGTLEAAEAKGGAWFVRDASRKIHRDFDAALFVLKNSPVFFLLGKALEWPPLRKAGSGVYRITASCRGGFSKLILRLRYRPLKVGLAWPFQILALFFMVYVFCWNLSGVYAPFPFPASLRSMGYILQLDQYWNMFSPPLRDDGWFVIPGKLRDGRIVDVYRNGAPVDWAKPKWVYRTYARERWRKYLTNLWTPAFSDYRLYYGQYLCRDWNARHGANEKLDEFEIFFNREGAASNMSFAPERISIWRHFCFQVPQPLPPSPFKAL